MPSKDTFHKGKPEANAWLNPKADKRPKGRELSGQVQRLAKRTGEDPDKLAERIPPDTLRRTKYPVQESKDEHGRRVFKHDPGIENDKRLAL